MKLNQTPAPADPGPPGPPIESPATSSAYADTAVLAQLKSRLLRDTLAHEPDEPLASILALAATEAEAQAWLTSYPLLTFPMLFEEKAEEVRKYLARQNRLRSASPIAGRG